MANVRTISLDELQQRLQRPAGLEFWNVLTDEWFKGELIPGSRRVPLDRVGREASEAGLAKEAEIVVYCAGPKCPQSALAAEKLGQLGYTAVWSYEGGLEEWKANGLTVDHVDVASQTV
jgi:rhodanese-related sulfurtransferase